MAIDPEEFFDKRQGAAVLKHGILKRYLAVFVSKVGSTAADHKVMYLDAYAGPGEYDDGGEGSPAVALATAELLRDTRNFVGIYVEKDEKNVTVHGSGTRKRLTPSRRGSEWVDRTDRSKGRCHRRAAA